MRPLIVVALVGACSFESGSIAVPDVPELPDVLVPTWAVDGASGKGVPVSSSEWTDVMAAIGEGAAPQHLWLMQETSGSLADSIGATALSPVNLPTYANTLPGWTRKGVGTVQTSGNLGFATTATGAVSGTSWLLLAYVAVRTPPPSDSSLLGIGADADHRYLAVTSSPSYKLTGSGVSSSTGTHDPGTTVHPILLALNARTSTLTAYTDQEELTAPWKAPSGAGPLVVVGNAAAGAADAAYLYGALWSGPAAELDSTAIKRMLETLGWSVSGY